MCQFTAAERLKRKGGLFPTVLENAAQNRDQGHGNICSSTVSVGSEPPAGTTSLEEEKSVPAVRTLQMKIWTSHLTGKPTRRTFTDTETRGRGAGLTGRRLRMAQYNPEEED